MYAVNGGALSVVLHVYISLLLFVFVCLYFYEAFYVTRVYLPFAVSATVQCKLSDHM